MIWCDKLAVFAAAVLTAILMMLTSIPPGPFIGAVTLFKALAWTIGPPWLILRLADFLLGGPQRRRSLG